MFEGLQGYEIILMYGGILVLLVLLFLLVFSIIKGRSVKEWVWLFVFPIVMIGYSGIQKIKFDSGVVELEKSTQQLTENPADSGVRNDLKEKLTAVENNDNVSPATRVRVAEARLHLGDTVIAKRMVDSIRRIDPANKEALILQRKFIKLRPIPIRQP